jgi:hypothetical protein
MLLQRLDDARIAAGAFPSLLSRRVLAVEMIREWTDDAEAMARLLVGLPARVARAKTDDVPQGLVELLEGALL